MMIRFGKKNNEKQELPPAPKPPQDNKAYTYERNVSIKAKRGRPPKRETPEAPDPPEPVKEAPEEAEEIEEPAKISRKEEKPEIPFEAEYFKENYADMFGTDSLIGADILKLNLLYAIYSELLKLRETLEGD